MTVSTEYLSVEIITLVEAFESGVLDLHDFYFAGNDYRYRFDVDAKQLFINLFRLETYSKFFDDISRGIPHRTASTPYSYDSS